MKTTLPVSSKGQVTIPKKARDKFGLSGAGVVSVTVTDKGILLKPVKRPADFVGALTHVFPMDAVAAVRELRDTDQP